MVAQVSWDPETNTITPDTQLPGWVFSTKLVAKPDQLIKRRGKAGLLALNKPWEEVKGWIAARAGKPQQVSPRPLRISRLYTRVHVLDLVGTRPRHHELCGHDFGISLLGPPYQRHLTLLGVYMQGQQSPHIRVQFEISVKRAVWRVPARDVHNLDLPFVRRARAHDE